MNDTEVEVALAEHNKEIGSLKHRMDKAEKIVDAVHEMAQDMIRLMEEIKHMNKSIEKLNVEVSELKNKPAQRWELVVTTIISALAGVFISTLF